jgi:hypothetical protein
MQLCLENQPETPEGTLERLPMFCSLDATAFFHPLTFSPYCNYKVVLSITISLGISTGAFITFITTIELASKILKEFSDPPS